MRVALVSRSSWGQFEYSQELAPEFDVLDVRSPYISYADLQRRYPPGWQPDAIVCWSIDYMPVPEGIEHAGCFTAAVVGDWNMTSQSLHLIGDAFDLLIADRGGCDMLVRAGFGNLRHALLWSYLPSTHRRLGDVERDVDVLFVGNFNQAVQAHRAPWLARVAQLAGDFRVVITTQTFGEEYAGLLNRARIVFNRSIRGEMNQRAYEAAACGALLFYERENLEVRDVFVDREDCVLYGDDDLEFLLRHYLEHEAERARIAESGWTKVQAYSPKNCLLRVFETAREAAAQGPTQRAFVAASPVDRDVQRAWQWLQAPSDPAIQAAVAALARAEAVEPRPDVLNSAGTLLGLAALATKERSPEWAHLAWDRAVGYEQRALELFPAYPVALFNLGSILDDRGDLPAAEGLFSRARSALLNSWLGVEHVFGPYHRSLEWNAFQMQMERAWSEHPFGASEWVQAVRTVLLWQTCRKLSDIALVTGNPDQAAVYAREAIPLLPREPISWSRLARALRLLGRLEESAEAYLKALEPAPLIEPLWLEMLPLLRSIGHPAYEQRFRFAANIAKACPSLSALRQWFAATAPELE